MLKILLVEDDKTIVTNLTEYLNGAGYIVRSVSGQAAAMAVLAEEKTDLVLLDVSLAEGNGFSACRAIKAEFDIPVIFLTASGDEYSTVTGFDLGADDYIPKPFRPRELLSRIKNVLRLTGSTGKTVKLGEVVVDTEKGTAIKNSKDLFLSALEYRLLLAFINNRGIVLTRERLLDSMWDVAGTYVNDNTLTVYIKRLRRRSRTTLPTRRLFGRFAGSDTRWTHDEAFEKQRGARRTAVAAFRLRNCLSPLLYVRPPCRTDGCRSFSAAYAGLLHRHLQEVSEDSLSCSRCQSCSARRQLN